MKQLKEVILFFLLISNLLIGSINLYLNLNTHNITENDVEEHFISSEAIMLYFYDPSCDHCIETTEMIDTYIEFGYNQFIDIEFVDITQDHSNILKQYQIVDNQMANVPIVLLLDKGEVIDSVFGVDQIFDLLDRIVSMTKPT
jgi:thiol-disulfide isomerase/thioredoxin